MDWQYPVCWQSDCSKGPSKDKEGFSNLLKSLRSAFDSAGGYELAVSVAGYPSVLALAYDLQEVGKAADIVNVMTYDYHGFWDGRTGHHSPLTKQVNGRENRLIYRQKANFVWRIIFTANVF